MKKLVPISIAVLLIILVIVFGTKRKSNCKCCGNNGMCPKCYQFSFGNITDIFKKKEMFTNTTSEVPGFYTISTTFPELTNNKTSAGKAYWI